MLRRSENVERSRKHWRDECEFPGAKSATRVPPHTTPCSAETTHRILGSSSRSCRCLVDPGSAGTDRPTLDLGLVIRTVPIGRVSQVILVTWGWILLAVNQTIIVDRCFAVAILCGSDSWQIKCDLWSYFEPIAQSVEQDFRTVQVGLVTAPAHASPSPHIPCSRGVENLRTLVHLICILPDAAGIPCCHHARETIAVPP